MIMMNNQQQQQSRFSTHQIARFYCRNQRALSVNVWKNYLSLQIADALPENLRQNGMIYDYQNQVGTLINGPQIVLVDYILTEIWDEYERIVVNKEREKGEKVPTYAIKNQELMIEFGYSDKKFGVDYQDEMGKAFYIMFNRLSATQSIGPAEIRAFYAFTPLEESTEENLIFLNYNYMTGETENSISLHSSFIQFKNLIHSIASNDLAMLPYSMVDNLVSKISKEVGSQQYAMNNTNPFNRSINSGFNNRMNNFGNRATNTRIIDRRIMSGGNNTTIPNDNDGIPDGGIVIERSRSQIKQDDIDALLEKEINE